MKRILFSLTALIVTGTFISQCYGLGDASTYKMTVQKVEAKKSDGTWISIFELNVEVDVGQAALGAEGIGAFLSGNLPPGSYVNFRVTLSEAVTIAGQDGASNFTAAGGNITISGTDANAASTSDWPDTMAELLLLIGYTEASETHAAAGPAGEVTVNLNLGAAKPGGDADNYIQVYGKADFATPVVIEADSVVSMFFDFDTTDTIQYIRTPGGNDLMIFTPPKEGTQFGVTVDDVSYAITEANMRVDF